jgi:hypothetical protein
MPRTPLFLIVFLDVIIRSLIHGEAPKGCKEHKSYQFVRLLSNRCALRPNAARQPRRCGCQATLCSLP